MWEPKYKKDKTKVYSDDWENLKIGDYVFSECISAMGSGGLSYEIGELVIDITKNEILTEDDSGNKSKWDRKTLNALHEPFGYYLSLYQKN